MCTARKFLYLQYVQKYNQKFQKKKKKKKGTVFSEVNIYTLVLGG